MRKKIKNMSIALIILITLQMANPLAAAKCVRYAYGKMPLEIAKKPASNSYLKEKGYNMLEQRTIGVRWILIGVLAPWIPLVGIVTFPLAPGWIAGAVYTGQADAAIKAYCEKNDCKCTEFVSKSSL